MKFIFPQQTEIKIVCWTFVVV